MVRSSMWMAVIMLVALGQVAPTNPYLEQARGHYEALRFSESRAALQLAAQVPTNTRAQQVEILELKARCELAEGRRAEAEASYAELLALEPQAEPPGHLSPKILEAFQAVKRRLFPAGYVALKPLPAAEGLVRVEPVDPWRHLEAVVLLWRGPGEDSWHEERGGSDEGVSRFQLPAEAAGPLSWYVEARGRKGQVLARLGSPETPRLWSRAEAVATAPVLLPPPPREGPLPARPWLRGNPERLEVRHQRMVGWAALGAAVLSGVGGAVLQIRSGASHESAVRAEWADESRKYQERANTQAGWAAGLFIGGGAAALAGGVLLAW